MITFENIISTLSVFALIVSLLWNLWSFKKSSKEEVERSAVWNANMELKLENIANDIKDIKIQQRLQSENYSAIRTETEVIKRDLVNAVNDVTELRVRLNNEFIQSHNKNLIR